jgi:hypothetical protein
MYEAHALFLSLPTSAQSNLRAVALQSAPVDMRKLTCAVYPYVQTLADAQDIAFYLAGEAEHHVDDIQAAHQAGSAVSPTNMLVKFIFGAPYPRG